MADTIRYGFKGTRLYVVAPEKLSGIKKGRINDQLRLLAQGAEEVVFELSGCQYLDSTFMGQLVALRREISPRTLVFANPSPEARQILTIMGLHRIIGIILENLPDDLELTELDSLDPASPESMLEAHQLLSQLSPENARRFEQVVKALQDSLKPKDQ